MILSIRSILIVLTATFFTQISSANITVQLPKSTTEASVISLNEEFEGLQLTIEDHGWQTSIKLSDSSVADFTPHGTNKKTFRLTFEIIKDSKPKDPIEEDERESINGIAIKVCNNIKAQLQPNQADGVDKEINSELQVFKLPQITNQVRTNCHITISFVATK